MSSLRYPVRQDTLGLAEDIYITPVTQYPPTDFLNEKAEIEVLPPPSLPEGGTRGWTNVVGGFFVAFCAIGAINSFGAYQDVYLRDFLSQSTPAQISWIGSTRAFLMFALSFPVGKFLDEGYFRLLVMLGTSLSIISQFIFAAVQERQYYQVFLVQGVLGGVASGLLFLPVTSVIPQYFSVRRSMVTAIVMMGSFLGGIVQLLAVNKLFSLRRGSNEFLMTAICLGVIYLVLLSPVNWLLRPRVSPSISGGPSLPQTNFWKDFLTDGPYVIATAGVFCVLFGLFFPYFYLQLYSVDQGASSKIVDNILVILNASAVLGCLIFIIPATFYKSLSVLILCSLILGVLTTGMLLLRRDVDILIFAILYGFFSGGLISMIGQIPLAFLQDDRSVNLRSGFWFCAVSGSVLIGPPLLGSLLGSPELLWDRPIITSAVLTFIGTFLLLTSRVIGAIKT